ncbi:PREDICTED: lipase maturation factor 1 isoform X2 [Cercocebus atys]|uniref:lipase maturation factor 1 isoform X2 n=1 Tax=Cercocebus atys TaxID=9531 RepID=UPI0005F483C1|nr:PREDICTED: lipase maturation factor 1 isoform X2 [Cercocebus atys]
MRPDGPTMAAPEESLRRRKTGYSHPEPESPPVPGRDPAVSPAHLHAGTFWLTRIVLLKALAFVYFVAFLVAFHQNKQLIGDRGLLPCRVLLNNFRQYFQDKTSWEVFSYMPTILWLTDWSDMNSTLDSLALLGLGISSFVLITGCANMLLMAALWGLYMSLVNVGHVWYSFGWESQLLETGFLGIFLCPLWTLSRLPQHTPTSRIVLWGFRWLIFRIMFGATQPVPNPLAYYLHHSPWWFHRFETLSTHFIELLVPFFLFLGRRACIIHGALQILFQSRLREPRPGPARPGSTSSAADHYPCRVTGHASRRRLPDASAATARAILIVSGNLSFLNWLTMVPSLACFDDATLGFLFPSGPGSLKDRVLQMQREIRGARPKPRFGSVVRRAANVSLGILLAWLSVPVVLNLLSPIQVMNTHFNSLHIVNTYGAFGSISKERTEVILQGTASPSASAPDAVWEDYEFKCKPGDPSRRPCLISPYHYRLDWLMWFASFQTYEHNDWILHLAGKLLASDAEALSLLAHNPFASRPPPRWVRGEHYRYKFSRPGGRHATEGKWWVRKRIGAYFPPLSLEELRPYFRDRGWPLPQPL